MRVLKKLLACLCVCGLLAGCQVTHSFRLPEIDRVMEEIGEYPTVQLASTRYSRDFIEVNVYIEKGSTPDTAQCNISRDEVFSIMSTMRELFTDPALQEEMFEVYSARIQERNWTRGRRLDVDVYFIQNDWTIYRFHSNYYKGPDAHGPDFTQYEVDGYETWYGSSNLDRSETSVEMTPEEIAEAIDRAG